MANLIVMILMRFLHNLFTVMWIGGMIVLGIGILPVIQTTVEKGERMKMVEAIRIRMNKLVAMSIIGLFLTGLFMSNASPSFEGYLSLANQYSTILSIKHVAVGVMVIITLVRNRMLSNLKSKARKKQQKITALLLIVNIIIGILVLFLSAWTAALTAMQANLN
ncbi:MAG: CopD family protein [Candidatus Thorarchaeota archaeon]|nr:CopD family protein [Candidatus Thorarchaeota archaeon]